eukprot:NODE_116_length_18347_cov_2.280962.p14 type:complete len:187 gc:universal NODE_116_length_18347_cov_2.280962:15293-14733(-)
MFDYDFISKLQQNFKTLEKPEIKSHEVHLPELSEYTQNQIQVSCKNAVCAIYDSLQHGFSFLKAYCINSTESSVDHGISNISLKTSPNWVNYSDQLCGNITPCLYHKFHDSLWDISQTDKTNFEPESMSANYENEKATELEKWFISGNPIQNESNNCVNGLDLKCFEKYPEFEVYRFPSITIREKV